MGFLIRKRKRIRFFLLRRWSSRVCCLRYSLYISLHSYRPFQSKFPRWSLFIPRIRLLVFDRASQAICVAISPFTPKNWPLPTLCYFLPPSTVESLCLEYSHSKFGPEPCKVFCYSLAPNLDVSVNSGQLNSSLLREVFQLVLWFQGQIWLRDHACSMKM